MGSIQPVYQRRHGKVAKPRRNDGYRAVWRDGEGKQRSRHFERKSDASRFLSQVEADLVRGEYIDPMSGKMTLGAYVLGSSADGDHGWFAAQPWRASTRECAQSHLRAHILPAFGETPLAQITRTQVQGFVTRLSDRLAPNTVEGVYRRLVSILESAVADRIVARSPAVKIKLPKRVKHPSDLVVALDAEAVHRLAGAVPAELRAFVWTMAAGGLRPGEAAGLTVERVDFLRKEIRVDRQLLTSIGAHPALGPVKTEASIRQVPIPEALVTELAAHIETHGVIDFEDGATLLFGNRDRRPLRRGTLAGIWQRARVRAELPAQARGWHTLRHSYASALIRAGLSVKAVQARLGHASAVETLDVYSHLWPDEDDDTRTVIEDTFGIDQSCSDNSGLGHFGGSANGVAIH